MHRARIVHAAYTSSVLIEFKEARDAETITAFLKDLKDAAQAEAKAERKEDMLARGAGG